MDNISFWIRHKMFKAALKSMKIRENSRLAADVEFNDFRRSWSLAMVRCFISFNELY